MRNGPQKIEKNAFLRAQIEKKGPKIEKNKGGKKKIEKKGQEEILTFVPTPQIEKNTQEIDENTQEIDENSQEIEKNTPKKLKYEKFLEENPDLPLNELEKILPQKLYHIVRSARLVASYISVHVPRERGDGHRGESRKCVHPPLPLQSGTRSPTYELNLHARWRTTAHPQQCLPVPPRKAS